MDDFTRVDFSEQKHLKIVLVETTLLESSLVKTEMDKHASHVSGEPQYINTLMYLFYGTCAQSRGFRQYFWWMTSLKLTFLNKRTWKLHKDCQDKIWILQQHWLQQEDFTLGLDISRLHYVKTGYGVSSPGL